MSRCKVPASWMGKDEKQAFFNIAFAMDQDRICIAGVNMTLESDQALAFLDGGGVFIWTLVNAAQRNQWTRILRDRANWNSTARSVWNWLCGLTLRDVSMHDAHRATTTLLPSTTSPASADSSASCALSSTPSTSTKSSCSTPVDSFSTTSFCTPVHYPASSTASSTLFSSSSSSILSSSSSSSASDASLRVKKARRNLYDLNTKKCIFIGQGDWTFLKRLFTFQVSDANVADPSLSHLESMLCKSYIQAQRIMGFQDAASLNLDQLCNWSQMEWEQHRTPVLLRKRVQRIHSPQENCIVETVVELAAAECVTFCIQVCSLEALSFHIDAGRDKHRETAALAAMRRGTEKWVIIDLLV